MPAPFPEVYIPKIDALKKDIKARPVRWGIIIVVLLLMIDALSVAAWMSFSSPEDKLRKAAASDSARPITPNKEIKNLFDKLRNFGANPILTQGSEIVRESFSVSGVLVTLQGDNIQVFEYSNRAAASADAEKFLKSDSRGKATLYIEDNILVIYTGNRKEVIDVLNKALGLPSGTN